MKVFEVVTEYCAGKGTEVTTDHQKDDIYFTQHCSEKVVAELLTIAQRIKYED